MWISISFLPNRDHILDRINSVSSLLSQYTGVPPALLCKQVLDVEPNHFTSKRVIVCTQDEQAMETLLCAFTLELKNMSESAQERLEQSLCSVLRPTIPPISQDTPNVGTTYMVHIDPTKLNTHQV